MPTHRVCRMEETLQSHLIVTTIFQTKSFDGLSEFAVLVSCATCSAYSAVLSCELEKMAPKKYSFELKKFD